MAIKRRHFTGCPGNNAFNVRASLRKASWGEALVAKSNSEVLKQPQDMLIDRSITVAGEEKQDGWACVCPELTVTLPGTSMGGGCAGGWEQSHPPCLGQGQHSWSVPRKVGLAVLGHNFPSPQVTTSQLQVLIPRMLLAVCYNSGGRTRTWRN